MTIILTIIVSTVVVALTGAGLYKYFITDRIMDGDGMENPNAVGNRRISETAELVDFFWHQTAMSFCDCFTFELSAAGQEAPVLRCKYMDVETGEQIEIGDWDYGTRLPVSSERWAELSDFLRKAELPPFRAPEPELPDAPDSHVRVTWRDGEAEFTEECSGEYAYDLLALLKDIAQEVNTAYPEA